MISLLDDIFEAKKWPRGAWRAKFDKKFLMLVCL